MNGAVAARACGAEGSKLLLDARHRQLNGTGIRVTTVDPGLADSSEGKKQLAEGSNRIIAEELARRGWQESEQASRRRSDPHPKATLKKPTGFHSSDFRFHQ